jgi:hypothetical protein
MEEPAMPVSFKELTGSPRETYGPEGMRAERRFLCAWEDRDALVQELLGDGYEFGGSTPAGYPGKSGVVAVGVAVEPFDEDLVEQEFPGLSAGLAAYHGFARVTARYELIAPADRDDLPTAERDTVLTYRMEAGSERLTLAGDDLVWLGNPDAVLPADAEGAIQLPCTRHVLTWHRVVNPPWTAIRNATGTLNADTFLGAPAGTLLFEGAVTEREFVRISGLAESEFAWRIEYRFRENTLTTVPTQPLFRATDFDALVTFDASG